MTKPTELTPEQQAKEAREYIAKLAEEAKKKASEKKPPAWTLRKDLM